MMQYIAALLLLVFSLGMVSVRKAYRLHTATELKRRARARDPVASALHAAVAYEPGLTVLLWILIILPFAGSFLLLRVVAPDVLVFAAEALAIGYAFAWAPSARVSSFSVRLTVLVSPLLEWILVHGHVVFERSARLAARFRRRHVHTRLYERDDLLELIEQQRAQSDSRIPPDMLDMLASVLQFGDKLVRDIMTPRRLIRLVPAEELVGPVLMRDLHDSGFQRFPVYDGEADNLVGVLNLTDITGLQYSGSVRGVMKPHVSYVNEAHSLEQVLDAFHKTGSHLFIVTNGRAEFAGLITIENILSQILGAKIVDDFDRYDDRSAVADYQSESHPEAVAKPAPVTHTAAPTKKPDAPATEMIE